MLQSILESDSRFGVIRWDPVSKAIPAVGCCAEVVQHKKEEDGRSNIVAIGQQRFRILEIIREAPYRTAMVAWVEDEEPDKPDQLTQIAQKVSLALKDVVDLTAKLTGSIVELPDDLPDLPRELSLWVASHLGGPVAEEQQYLLELTDTRLRLQREYDMLDQTRRQLAARTVLKDTFANVE